MVATALLAGCFPTITRGPLDKKNYVLGKVQTSATGSAIIRRELGMQARGDYMGRIFNWSPLPGAVLEEILYQGGSGKNIKMGYKEYRITQNPLTEVRDRNGFPISYNWKVQNFYAAPAQFQPLEYERNPSGTTTVSFQKYVIEVISAGNSKIEYRVISDGSAPPEK